MKTMKNFLLLVGVIALFTAGTASQAQAAQSQLPQLACWNSDMKYVVNIRLGFGDDVTFDQLSQYFKNSNESIPMTNGSPVKISFISHEGWSPEAQKFKSGAVIKVDGTTSTLKVNCGIYSEASRRYEEGNN